MGKSPKPPAKQQRPADPKAASNRITEWVDRRGFTLEKVAELTGFSQSYLSRMANSKRNVNLKNLTVIAKALQVRLSDLLPDEPEAPAAKPGYEPTSSPTGFGQEGEPYKADETDLEREASVEDLLRRRPNAYAVTMKSDVLALKGIRAGDVLIIDDAIEAKNGDVVRAQIYDDFGARTVFRIYAAPHLIAAPLDPAAVPPETVDGERVRIAGVMIAQLRRRG